MKKIILIISLVTLFSGKALAQGFNLTQDGFTSASDQSKSFVILEANGTQQELYNKTKTYLMRLYKSPKDVLSEAYPETITINGISKDAVQKKTMGMIVTSYDMNYTIVLMFKDGKIRIDAPSFSLFSYGNGKPIKMHLKGKSNGGFGSEVINTIYNDKGNLKAEYAKKQLESFFNEYIQNLKNGIVEYDKEDW